MKGSEIFVPFLPSVKILDIVKALNKKPNFIGLRPEKNMKFYAHLMK